MDVKSKARELVSQMTLQEKAALLTGSEFYRLRGNERLGLPAVYVEDGPHGLRMQAAGEDHLGLQESLPATCFPTAATVACSFDRALLYREGVALGEECRAHDVGVLLGPGINMKRSPLCGRNFEYFSEDPYLAGELAASWVAGVQSQNVGASLKHFAANNQETRRMVMESVIDERALHEIYLSAFERVVRKAQPWTIMLAYNILRADFTDTGSSQHACDNRALITDILRNAWGFEGVAVSDWGGECDRFEGIRAGLDMEMPYVNDAMTNLVVAAVEDGTLDEELVDECATRVTELIVRSQAREPLELDVDAHHELARRAARESAVLLKNEDGLLPGDPAAHIAVIGAFAKTPRYQGTGSSKINPFRLDCAYDALAAAVKKAGGTLEYADGYSVESEQLDEGLIAEACEVAEGKDVVYVFAGLTDAFESEGYDRTDMRMPANQDELIARVAERNDHVVVVLATGAPVEMPWEAHVKAVLLTYLGGQAGGSAVVDLLLGRANPSGKLAESWPYHEQDNPTWGNFPGYSKTVEYRESIYIGYRYYDTARKEVRYPFGYGLSYTEFEYSHLRLSDETSTDGNVDVSVNVTNIGQVAGAEVAQLYVSNRVPGLFMAEQELKGFERVELDAGQTKTVTFRLGPRAFSYYNTAEHAWCLAAGRQGVRVGSSSRNIRLHAVVDIEPTEVAEAPDMRTLTPSYFNLAYGIDIPDSEFEALYGHPLPAREREAGTPFTADSTVADVHETWLGRRMAHILKRQVVKTVGDDAETMKMVRHMMDGSPIRMLRMVGGNMITPQRVDGVVKMLNGHFFRGLGMMGRAKK